MAEWQIKDFLYAGCIILVVAPSAPNDFANTTCVLNSTFCPFGTVWVIIDLNLELFIMESTYHYEIQGNDRHRAMLSLSHGDCTIYGYESTELAAACSAARTNSVVHEAAWWQLAR